MILLIVASILLVLVGVVFTIYYFMEYKPGLAFIIAMVALFGGCGGCQVGCTNTQTASGSEVGTVSHYGQEGWIWKTNEGELTLGIMQNGTGSMHNGQTNFCVTDSKVSEQVNQALQHGTPVRIHYRELGSNWPWICSNKLIIERIEPFIKEPK